MQQTLKTYFLLLCVGLLFSVKHNEGRYLPTRAHANNLDKLRELMYQILDSSNESTDDRPSVSSSQVPWAKQAFLENNVEKSPALRLRFGSMRNYDGHPGYY